MNTLGRLEIIGALSPCSVEVCVQNQLIGSTVSLRVGSEVVGGAVASWCKQSFLLKRRLKSDERLVATQALPGFNPSEESLPTTVGPLPTPAALSAGSFATPIHECARCVWLYGLFPGATVEVISHGDLLGKAQAGSDGQVHVDLNRPLNIDDRPTAILTGCNDARSANPIDGGRVQRLKEGEQLAPPTIRPPLQCDAFILVEGIRPGAQVAIARGTSQVGEFCSPLPSLIVTGIPKLRPAPVNDMLAAQQFFSEPCNLKNTKLPPPTKIRAGNPDAPKVLLPLCEDQTYVEVDGLRQGATVELNLVSRTLVFGAVSGFQRFPVPPLVSGTTVTVRQNTCGESSSWSALSPILAQVGSKTPAVPVPTVPANGAKNVNTKPSLNWNDPGSVCNVATAFDLQIATNASFTAGLVKFNRLTAKAFTIPSALATRTQYFWRVKSFKGAKASAWSAVFNFTTQKEDGPSNPPTPPPEPRQYCFVEDCCPNYRRVISVTASSYADAYRQAVAKAGSTCKIEPLEVPCHSKVPPCG